MNRARIRIGEAVKEFPLDIPKHYDLNMVEDAVNHLLHKAWFLAGYRLEYLGEFSWDIFMDDRRIGHVKAWKQDKPDKDQSVFPFRCIGILTFFAYLALC